jgi:hypothetical protein
MAKGTGCLSLARAVAAGRTVENPSALRQHLAKLFADKPEQFLREVLRREESQRVRMLEEKVALLEKKLASSLASERQLSETILEMKAKMGTAGPVAEEECVRLAEKWLTENMERASQ